MAAHACNNSAHTEANEKYWSSAADTVFKQEYVLEAQRMTLDHLKKNLSWLGVQEGQTKAKFMDYACGEGYISRVGLSPQFHLILNPIAKTKAYGSLNTAQFFTSYFSKCIGVDVAERMIEQFNMKARAEGFPEEKLYAVQGSLSGNEASPSMAQEEFFNFDFIVISMALHHLSEPQLFINHAFERLAPGGTLLVIDIEIDPHSDLDLSKVEDPAARTIAHSGFTKDELENMMSQSGYHDFEYSLMQGKIPMPGRFGGDKQLFFACARK
ncbi:hypothetical protein FQN57_004408 [Myotisia sp. PD_48]|nr:hypothetical protein FQN57_004408 [Myotisia sp. PD_48]